MRATTLPGVAAIVVAAGRGERLGLDVPKALATVGGRPLVAVAVEHLIAAGIDDIVVVHPVDAEAAFLAALADTRVTLVAGGASRSISVRNGLAALPPATERVAVHDAARALQPAAVIRAAVDAVTGDVLASAPAVPVADTIKRVAGERIMATVPRDDLVAVQTPQVFVAAALRAAHEVGEEATDDLVLVERLVARGDLVGHVHHVPGSSRGTKVTRPEDLILVEALGTDLGGAG